MTAEQTYLKGSVLSTGFYDALISRAPEIERAYRAQTTRSEALSRRARRTFPGGFTRDAIVRMPYAPFIASAQGTQIEDADGRRRTDLWFNATSLPLGHAHPKVTAAAEAQLGRGSAYFGPTEHELALGELLINRLPCAERLRFANSGSEAVMMALRFARAARQRTEIVKFEGSYHGSYDDVSWSVGSQPCNAGPIETPRTVAETAGLGPSTGRVQVLPYNDVDQLRDYVRRNHHRIAAILIEPIANRMGLILPDAAFTAEARALCDRYGPVLIFDEVIAFRLSYGGAQTTLSTTPDLVTLGKIIGGGFPVGAIAGRADILDLSDPASQAGRVTHAGTFNGNPMVGAAGLATMERLTPEAFDRMDEMGRRMRSELRQICKGLPLQVSGAASLFKINATDRTIRNYGDALTANIAWEQTASLALLNEGFMLTPRLSGCVSAVTTCSEIEAFLEAFRRLVTN